MRSSVRPTTASTTSETTRVTCSSQSTTNTPWRRSHRRLRGVHHALRSHIAHTLWCRLTPNGSRSESGHKHLHSHPWAFLLESLLPFYFHLFFPVFSFHLLHFELYPEFDNLIVMESLCYSANMGVTTPTTSPPPSQVMSPTSWPSASSTTHRSPSPSCSRHRTKTWMTWHSASCSQRHPEDKPITANQKTCLSVSRRRLLRSMDQGNLMEKEMSTNQLVLGPRETRTVLTARFLKTPKLRNDWWIRETWWARKLERTD